MRGTDRAEAPSVGDWSGPARAPAAGSVSRGRSGRHIRRMRRQERRVEPAFQDFPPEKYRAERKPEETRTPRRRALAIEAAPKPGQSFSSDCPGMRRGAHGRGPAGYLSILNAEFSSRPDAQPSGLHRRVGRARGSARPRHQRPSREGRHGRCGRTPAPRAAASRSRASGQGTAPGARRSEPAVIRAASVIPRGLVPGRLQSASSTERATTGIEPSRWGASSTFGACSTGVSFRTGSDVTSK